MLDFLTVLLKREKAPAHCAGAKKNRHVLLCCQGLAESLFRSRRSNRLKNGDLEIIDAARNTAGVEHIDTLNGFI